MLFCLKVYSQLYKRVSQISRENSNWSSTNPRPKICTSDMRSGWGGSGGEGVHGAKLLQTLPTEKVPEL